MIQAIVTHNITENDAAIAKGDTAFLNDNVLSKEGQSSAPESKQTTINTKLLVLKSDIPTPSPMKGPKNKWKKCYTHGGLEEQSKPFQSPKHVCKTQILHDDKENCERSVTGSTNSSQFSQPVQKLLNKKATPTKEDKNVSSTTKMSSSLKRKVISPLSTVQTKNEAQAKFLATSQEVSHRVSGHLTSPDTSRLVKRMNFNKIAKEAIPQYPREIKTALRFVF